MTVCGAALWRYSVTCDLVRPNSALERVIRSAQLNGRFRHATFRVEDAFFGAIEKEGRILES